MAEFIKVDSETNEVQRTGRVIFKDGEWVEVDSSNKPDGYLDLVDIRPTPESGKIVRISGYDLSGDRYVARYEQVNIAEATAEEIAAQLKNTDLTSLNDFQKTQLLKSLAKGFVSAVLGD